jgi:hypothetical protein
MPVSYGITSGTGLASLSGATITYNTAGTVQITASQTGNSSYPAAANVTDIVTVQALGSLAVTGYTGGGLSTPAQVVIDGLGFVWVTNDAPLRRNTFLRL